MFWVGFWGSPRAWSSPGAAALGMVVIPNLSDLWKFWVGYFALDLLGWILSWVLDFSLREFLGTRAAPHGMVVTPNLPELQEFWVGYFGS